MAAIVPWNFPLLMATWKVAPALAAWDGAVDEVVVRAMPGADTLDEHLALVRAAQAAAAPASDGAKAVEAKLAAIRTLTIERAQQLTGLLATGSSSPSFPSGTSPTPRGFMGLK